MAAKYLKDTSVGDVVKLNVNGTATECVIVQKGNPNRSKYTLYPADSDTATDEGVWLLFKSSVTEMSWNDNNSNGYEKCKIRDYLNGDFLNLLDSKIANAVMKVTYPYYSTTLHNYYSATEKVFLLSATELGFPQDDLKDAGSNTGYVVYGDGVALGYFSDNSYSKRSFLWYAWTRTAEENPNDTRYVGMSYYSGMITISQANLEKNVNPVLVLSQDCLVDDDGIVFVNDPPSAPYGITVPSKIRARHSVTISWGASTDSEGNLSGYRLYEIRPDSDARAVIYDGTSRSYTYTVPDIAKVQYSVCAYDTYGSVSEETLSAVRSVTSNSLPTITTSSGSSLGTRTSGFKIAYTVDDADAEDTITVKEYLDGKQKRSFTATHGGSYSFDVTGEYFQTILNGEHTLEIVADDGNYTSKDAQSGIQTTTTKKFTFTKSVHNAVITLAEPMTADDQITLCIISVTGSIPSDATFEVEVTNNGNDSLPVWEDCTTAARNGYNHSFKNQTAANGYAFNFRVTAGHDSTSSTEGYIQSIQGGFQ